MSKVYNIKEFKCDAISGIFDGLLFNICYGFVNSSYQNYSPTLVPKQYMKLIARSTGRTIILLSPVLALAKITSNYTKAVGYTEMQSGLMTFAIVFSGVSLLTSKRLTGGLKI